jgi:hypothetical protein
MGVGVMTMFEINPKHGSGIQTQIQGVHYRTRRSAAARLYQPVAIGTPAL